MMLTKKAQQEIEESFELTKQAWDMLDLIVAEFESDPLSVQCFDLRMVEKAKKIVKRKNEIKKSNPWSFN